MFLRNFDAIDLQAQIGTGGAFDEDVGLRHAKDVLVARAQNFHTGVQRRQQLVEVDLLCGCLARCGGRSAGDVGERRLCAHQAAGRQIFDIDQRGDAIGRHAGLDGELSLRANARALQTLVNGVIDHGLTAVNSKVHPQQLPVFHIDKTAACVPCVARVQHGQSRALGQRGDVELDDVGLRTNVVEAELALGVGDDEGAVLHVEAHIRNAALFKILNPVAVAVGIDLADDEAAVAEHAGQHLHRNAGDVADLGGNAGGDACTKGLGAVDAVALQGARPHAHAVGQGEHLVIFDRTEVKDELGADAAFGLRQLGAIQTHDACIQAGAVWHIGKTGGQVVFHLNLAQQLAAAVFDLDGVVHKLTQFNRGARDCFFNEQATQGAGIERHVNVHRPGGQIDQELTAVRAFGVGGPPGGQQRRWQDRRKAVAAGRRDQQFVGAWDHSGEFVMPVGTGDHGAGGGGDAVSLEHHRRGVGADVED